jgi:F0F1-type ATP synthase membrane subunit b/b'
VNNIELWKLILAAAVFVFTTITGPILWMMRAQSKVVEEQIKALGAELRKEMAELGANLRKEMAEMEKRLNERIDTRLVHR